MQFLVIGRDGTDPEAFNRRQAARPEHIKLGDRYRAEGKHLLAVAMLNEEGKMAGSVLLVDFPDRGALDAWLAEEPYVTGKVWASVEVTPCQVGPSFQSLFQSEK